MGQSLIDISDDESQLTKEERIRRVVLLCANFTRNLAYYRGAKELPVGWGG
jgi:hypothetical protein